MIILDTVVVSEPLRRQPDPRVTSWLDAQSVDTLCLTTLTIAEVRYGVACLSKGRRRDELNREIEQAVLPLFGDRIFHFDDAAMREYAERRARARRQGETVGDVDALIASIAAARKCAVATRDTAPFEAMGVEVINPFET